MFGKSSEKKFLKAAQAGDIPEMEKWLAKGVHIDTRNSSGETALRIAAVNNDLVTTRFLLDKGANPNITDTAGRSPLSRAAGEGFNALLKLLLAAPDIDVDAQKKDGDTALRLAVVNNQVESVRLLLEAGANPDIQNADGNTPLIRAVAQGYTEITKLLLQHGANPHIRNNELMTAIDHAKTRRQYTTMQLVEEFLQQQAGSTQAPVAALEQSPRNSGTVTEKNTAAALPAAAWHVTDDQEIARVSDKPAIGKKITEIFNFRSERVITIIKDIDQNSETTLEKNFADVQNTGWLEDAAKAYEAETGIKPDFPSTTLQKSKPGLR